MANTTTQLVRIDIDSQQLDEVVQALDYIKDGAAIACMRALNKTVTGCISDTAKAIYAEINVTQARIKKDIGFTKASKLILSASVTSKGKKIELIEFGARQVTQGVTFQIKRAGPRIQMHYGFIGKSRSDDSLHVFHRKGAQVGTGKPIGVPKAGFLWTFPGKWSDTYRKDTRKQYGPSVPDIFGKDSIFSALEAAAAERLASNLAHEADYLISQNTPTGDGGDEIV